MSLQQDYASTIRRVLPSVVEIKTASGLGSGVVYDAAGHIVTNAHVVGSATSFQVVLAGSPKPLPAHLTGSYPPDDLAVMRICVLRGPARALDLLQQEVVAGAEGQARVVAECRPHGTDRQATPEVAPRVEGDDVVGVPQGHGGHRLEYDGRLPGNEIVERSLGHHGGVGPG